VGLLLADSNAQHPQQFPEKKKKKKYKFISILYNNVFVYSQAEVTQLAALE